MATTSECRHRWLRLPATTFVITHSPSQSNRRDGRDSCGMLGGDGADPAAGKCDHVSSRMTGGHFLLIERPETLIACAVCTENLIRVDDVMESPKLAE